MDFEYYSYFGPQIPNQQLPKLQSDVKQWDTTQTQQFPIDLHLIGSVPNPSDEPLDDEMWTKTWSIQSARKVQIVD